MNPLDELRSSTPSPIIFECMAGSHAYGTSTSSSDEDIRGVFAVPATSYLRLIRPTDQISDARGDTVYYSLRRFVELLAHANPNILELLFTPDDCIRTSSPEMDILLRHKHLFVSKQCADTHAGYAMAQLKEARGQNKWINNPKSEQAPRMEDFCYIIPRQTDPHKPPARPVPLTEIGWMLSEYHAAR